MQMQFSMFVGNIPVYKKISLSPMAGISDSPYRKLCREMGAAFSYTEFVSTDELSHYSSRAISLLKFEEIERPIWFQIFGNNLETIVKSALIIQDLAPDVIDLNMGCSTSKVSQRGSGAGLLKNPIYVGKIIQSMVKSLNVPVTAKIRIGWDEASMNYKDVVHVLQESGISMISVHGRTKSMGYTGKARWDIIQEIKSFAKVPIWGNGDIQTYKEAIFRLNSSGVDGVLIGRAAIGNPWIFSGINKQTLIYAEIRNVILKHLRYMLEFYGESQGVILFRKHLAKYLNHYEGIETEKTKLLTTQTLKDLYMLLYDLEDKIQKLNSLSRSCSLKLKDSILEV